MAPPPLPRELWECVHGACIRSVECHLMTPMSAIRYRKCNWSFCGHSSDIRLKLLQDVKVLHTLDAASTGTRVTPDAWRRILEHRRLFIGRLARRQTEGRRIPVLDVEDNLRMSAKALVTSLFSLLSRRTVLWAHAVIVSDDAEALRGLLVKYPHFLIDTDPFLVSLFSDHWCLLPDEPPKPPKPVLVTSWNEGDALGLGLGLGLLTARAARITMWDTFNTDAVHGLTLMEFVQYAATSAGTCQCPFPRVWSLLRPMCQRQLV